MPFFFRSILIGMFTATIITIPFWMWSHLSDFDWKNPLIALLGLGLILLLCLALRGKTHNGVADLLLHIHSRPTGATPAHWTLRGVISFIFSLLGGTVGPEGAAVEFGHGGAMATRGRSAKWFDHQRRTDAACVLSGSLSASFGAPLGALVVPMEYRMGGNNLAPVLSSLSSFFFIQYLDRVLGLGLMNFSKLYSDFEMTSLHDWRLYLIALMIVVTGVVIGGGFPWLVNRLRKSFSSILATRVLVIYAIGTALLAVIILSYRPGYLPPELALEKILGSEISPVEVGFHFASQFLFLLVVLSVFGTAGVFWPIFTMGALSGYLLGSLYGDFGLFGAMMGAAAFWGATLGLPISVSLIVLGVSQNIALVFPTMVVAFAAMALVRVCGFRTLSDEDLQSRGLNLDRGRSKSILDSLLVGEAMVTDYESAKEDDTIDDLYSRMHRSVYPFLPIVNNAGGYLGMLTADLIEEAWKDQDDQKNSKFNKILEAKDLIYRTGSSLRTVMDDERLSVTTGIFDESPVVPVLNQDQKVVGLLFAHNVRIAYDQEVGRRSLFVKHESRSDPAIRSPG